MATGILHPYGVLYPSTGRLDGQHLTLPANCINSSPDVDGILNQLSAEIKAVSPRLTLLSSEVFSELAKRKPEACTSLLQKISKRWKLELVQVVRPQLYYFLSALKHQLRSGTFVEALSPLDWYEHCQNKSRLLDCYWPHVGIPLITLPYQSSDSRHLLISFLAEKANIGESGLRRLLLNLPGGRENGSVFSSAIYASYFVYLVSYRAGAIKPCGDSQCQACLPFVEFVQLLMLNPVELRELELCCCNDDLLGQFCRDYYLKNCCLGSDRRVEGYELLRESRLWSAVFPALSRLVSFR